MWAILLALYSRRSRSHARTAYPPEAASDRVPATTQSTRWQKRKSCAILENQPPTSRHARDPARAHRHQHPPAVTLPDRVAPYAHATNSDQVLPPNRHATLQADARTGNVRGSAGVCADE